MDPGYTLGYNNIVVNTATNARSEQDLPDPSELWFNQKAASEI